MGVILRLSSTSVHLAEIVELGVSVPAIGCLSSLGGWSGLSQLTTRQVVTRVPSMMAIVGISNSAEVCSANVRFCRGAVS